MARKYFLLILFLICIAILLCNFFHYSPSFDKFSPPLLSKSQQLNKNRHIYKREIQKQAQIRKKIILDQWNTSGIPKSRSLQIIQEVYMPQLDCPTMLRVGPVGDNGYVVCNPWMLTNSEPPCVLYSLGINGIIDFEKAFYDITNRTCQIYCFDTNNEPEQIFKSFNGIFMKTRIGSKTNPSKGEYTILDITKKYGHTKLDVLKMDIESAEFSSLPVFLGTFKGPPVCQILLELHGAYGETSKDWVQFLVTMEKSGYRLFYREVNVWSTPNFYYSYIHQDCLAKFDLDQEAVQFTYFV